MHGIWTRLARTMESKPTKLKRATRLSVEALETRFVLNGSGLADIEIIESVIPPNLSKGDIILDLSDKFSPTGTAPQTIPALNSKPGTAASLYLDFNGHYLNHWGGFGLIFGYSNLDSPSFDLDGNTATFNQAEIDAITDIFHRVSEDYAPFNINVTTVEPSDFSNGTALRVVIGGKSTDWYEDNGNTRGVSVLNSYTNLVENVAYVFSDHFGDNTVGIAKTTSHEAGHAFGLEHQETSLDDRFSIMKQGIVSGSSGRTVWSEGVQDDMAVLSGEKNGSGYRVDDHASTTGTAADMNSATNNVVTPFTQTMTRQGIISQTTDADVFAFHTEGGEVTLHVAVAAVGANLDARLELRNEYGGLIAFADPDTSLDATITMTLASGKYFVSVKSHGDYGDVGQYTLTASVPRIYNPAPPVPPGGGNFDPPMGAFNPDKFLPLDDLQLPTLPNLPPLPIPLRTMIQQDATTNGEKKQVKKKLRHTGRKRLGKASLMRNGLSSGKTFLNKVSLDH